MKLKFILFLFCFLTFSCSNEPSSQFIIAASANMQFAIKEIAENFSKKTNHPCEIILGSSGKLTAQIEEGAPYDIFLSADMKYPHELYRRNMAIEKPKVYAHGKLVAWSISRKLRSIHDLKLDSIEHIAIANPKNAPYGIATIAFLKNINIYDNIKSKLVYGESISQVNQFVFSKAADIGFTSKSVVLSSDLKDKGSWIELEEEKYPPIQQGILILKNAGSKLELAHQFSDFLFSKEGKIILEKYGYSTTLK